MGECEGCRGGRVDKQVYVLRFCSSNSVPMGVRLACTIVASPGAVRIVPVIEMAACLWMASRRIVIALGLVSA